MKKLALALVALIALFSLGGCADNGFMKDSDIKDIDTITGSITFSYTDTEDESKTYTVSFELYYQKAPITVTNFVKLVKDKFYDDTYCKKYSMAVGGEFITIDAFYEEDDAKKQKSLDYYIKGEFEENGWDKNDIEHTFGTMSMALSGGNDTAGFEFIVCLDNEGFKSRDGLYAAFGKLIDIDNLFFEDLKMMGSSSLYDYDFKVVEIEIDGNVNLGEPLKIKK